jgi:hypothetical protein
MARNRWLINGGVNMMRGMFTIKTLMSKNWSLLTFRQKYIKLKVIPQQAEVAHGIPGRLSLRIFLTFGITRVVGRHPYAPAAFTPG